MHSKRLFLWLFTGITGLLFLEAACYGLARLIPRHFSYRPPTRAEFLTYLDSPLDWELGWLPRADELAPEGFRTAPAGTHLNTPCVSLYGDSFTFGTEVAAEEAWGNVLSGLLGCRVDNYGVIGYGTDQAYLYFQRQQRTGTDRAPLVILSHLSENIVRNITQDLGLVYGQGMALKPRFVRAGDGTLQRLGIPRLTPEDYAAYVHSQARFFPDDYLLPNHSQLSMRQLFFPYLFSLPYVLTYKRIYQSALFYALDVPPWFAELYQPEHPSQALPVTREILRQFVREATGYGKQPLIFLLPTARDLLYFQRTGRWSYATLVAALQQDALPFVHLGPLLLARSTGADLCVHFCTNTATRSGHYTASGHRILAAVAQEVLARCGTGTPLVTCQ